MFSDNVEKQLRVLKINTDKPINEIRLLLETKLDETKNLINTKSHHKYEEVKDAYSVFMEEYTRILDLGDALLP